jgi:hypothetical protein
MVACLDLKFHKELKLFDLSLKKLIRKAISNFLLFLEELI